MLRSQNSNCLNWHYLLVGLFFVIMQQSDARAVNVSNTWTMPQEGLNVFYRFFRDRISWFEADAVCQFHHANLVTVDNSFQFDATRDLLRELDVNDIVWIGLMRPQSSDRFMWSNSRPLVADTGYWAESLPLMDAPLCAVIDPIRDYRWHALRCGGPETASFLCEMPVPSWADACNLKDMPNLTLQYMADTASIELIRNCQEEGLLRTMCRGKQDRERAMQDLICPRERLEAQRINDITNSHFKSLQIINSIPSDNNENNDIELLPMEVNYGPHYPEELQTEKNTVQRLIEQFNVDELMQADEPSNMETVSSFYKIPGLIPKPVKKSSKKVLNDNKKSSAKEKSQLEDLQKLKKPLNVEDMMMGDQPLQGEPELTEQLLNEEVSNEILEPLPHIKKTNIHKEDMEKMEKDAIAFKKNMQKTKELENKKMYSIMGTTTTTTTTTTAASTTTEDTKTTNILTTATATAKPFSANKEETLTKANQHDVTTIASSVGIGHPIHPQQQQQQQFLRNQQLLNEEQHQQQHNKEAADNSHFIPPMLLVKSHYVPPASKHGHNEHEHHTHSHYLDTTTKQQHQIQNKTEIDLKETTLSISSTTTPKTTTAALNLDLEKTTLSSATDSSFKAITYQPATETEQQQHQNLESLLFKEMQTTITATTSHPVSYTNNDEDSQKPATVALAEVISSLKDETHKNEKEMPELKLPQTTNENAERIATTKLLTTTADKATEKSTENFFVTETTEPATKIANKENEEKIVVETTIKTEAATQTTTTEQSNDNKQGLTADNRKEEAGEKQDNKETIAKTTDILGISMSTASAATTTTTTTERMESKKDENLKEKEPEKEEANNITTLIVKTTTNTTPITMPTASISLTTTTTVKPITITTTTTEAQTTTTTMPQNEVKSTETSVSSTSSATITTTNTNNNNNDENNRPTNTPAITETTTAINTETSSSTSTNAVLKTLKIETEKEAETETEAETVLPAIEKSAATEVSAAAIEIATSTPTPTSETTTRNFLKSTTDMPFKPNRRRSLTKPETGIKSIGVYWLPLLMGGRTRV